MEDRNTGNTPSATKRGIPTTYRGIRYRSRTEARWAVFFDQLGWPAEYEPIDLCGYIPDFIISFRSAPILVEIKAESYIRDLREAEAKIDASGWDGEALILGSTPFLDEVEHWNDLQAMGSLREVFTHTEDGRTETIFTWGDAAPTICAFCGTRGFRSVDGLFRNRACGHGDGDHYLGDWPESDLRAIWANAVNTTQWNAKRS